MEKEEIKKITERIEERWQRRWDKLSDMEDYVDFDLLIIDVAKELSANV